MQTLDETRIEAFAGQIATEVGAALNAALVTVGDQLGLYRAMADAQPIRADELAARTKTHERYVREWLNARYRPSWSPTVTSAAFSAAPTSVAI